MRHTARSIAAALFALFTFAWHSAGAQPPPATPYTWLQYAADGKPHVRVATADACPTVRADGIAIKMFELLAPAPQFAMKLCDAAVPAHASKITAGGVTLPRVPHTIRRIAVLGDSGCRIKGWTIQNCNDPAAWPFARIARAVASDRPDLIVHVGDYEYREAACPHGDARCANTPYGDTWAAWNVDFFKPAAPLFGAAPIVAARGNHEDCDRAGIGWSRYLAPEPSATCREHEAPAIVSFDNLRIVNVDSANSNEDNPIPQRFEAEERTADDAARGRETWLVTHRPPVAYLATHRFDDRNGRHLGAILAGHFHVFAALPFRGAPPTIIVGTGGDNLGPEEAAALAVVFRGTTEARFGYSLFERRGDGWTISERDPDGSEHRRCVLRKRTVHC
ncbi:MAG: metallophosphoesterase [Candidatus Velthaea sp.]